MIQTLNGTYLMVVTISIGPLGDMLEAIIIEQPQKARITRMAKIHLADLLFENLGDMNTEGAAVGHPVDV